MHLRLYIVHGSHPCVAVEKELTMKGLSYEVTEWPPPLHAPIQKALFGVRTAPALKIDGEKLSGSRAIMRRLDQIVPEPPLYPADPSARAKVEEAERWGDEMFQPVARELI
jgi:glutathione S-transferase